MSEILKSLSKKATFHELTYQEVISAIANDYASYVKQGKTCIVVSPQGATLKINQAVQKALKREELLGPEHIVKQLVPNVPPTYEVGKFVYCSKMDNGIVAGGSKTSESYYYEIVESNKDSVTLKDPSSGEVFVPIDKSEAFLKYHDFDYTLTMTILSKGEKLQRPLNDLVYDRLSGNDEIVENEKKRNMKS